MTRAKRLSTAGYILTTIGAGQPTGRFAVGAIHWGVEVWNPRTNSFVTSGSSVQGRGGTRQVAIRCWRCAVRSITGPLSRCLGGLNTRKQVRKNHLKLPFVPLPHLVLPTQVPFLGEEYGWGRLVSGRPCAVSTAYLQSRADWEAVWGSSTGRHGVQGTRARFFPTVHR